VNGPDCTCLFQDWSLDALSHVLSQVVVPAFVPKSNTSIVTDESVKKTDVKKVEVGRFRYSASTFFSFMIGNVEI
jgi:hypothetical protein